MAEAKINDMELNDSDPWLMDGGPMFYPSDLDNLEPLPKELEEKLNTLADEAFASIDKVQSAA